MADLSSKLTSKLSDFLSPKNPPARITQASQPSSSHSNTIAQLSPICVTNSALESAQQPLPPKSTGMHSAGLDYASSKDSSATESLPPSPLVDATTHPAITVITEAPMDSNPSATQQSEAQQSNHPVSSGSIFQFPGFAQSLDPQSSTLQSDGQKSESERGIFSFAFPQRAAVKRMSPAMARKSVTLDRAEELSGMPRSAPASFTNLASEASETNELPSNGLSFLKKFSRPRRDSNPTRTFGSVLSRLTTELRGVNNPRTSGGRRATFSSDFTSPECILRGDVVSNIADGTSPKTECKISTDDSKIPVFDYEGSKLSKFRKVLEQPHIDLGELKRLSWSGIPSEVRPMVWQLLMDYLPCNSDRRESTLARKRNEYFECLKRYFGEDATERTEYEEGIYRQIHIDMPRTHPLVPLFQQTVVQEILERILYVWSIRHPASGYVQGINDLVTPFFVIFLSQFVDGDVDTCDISKVSSENLSVVEADSYWCLSKLLDSIQDNYTFAQHGIQRQVHRLKELIAKTEPLLYSHLEAHQIQFLQFAFRWMNCFLIREIPLKHIIRMWDTYLVEENGFVGFHLYVCASFLRSWSSKIQGKDFQETLMFLQHLPTENWGVNDIELLLSNAFILKELYHGSGHTRL